MLPLTKEELKSHQDARNCYICEKRILKTLLKSINYRNVRDHCHYTGKYKGAAESGRSFECLGENTGKYKTFSAPTEKEVTKTDKDGSKCCNYILQNKIY